MNEMLDKDRTKGLGVWICFFFSGFSGLIYEVVWTRRFELVFGATTYAVGVVLTAFMGGLCLGSWASGRLADSVKKPLWFYGLIEICVGLYALSFPLILSLVVTAYEHLEQALHPSSGLSLAIRFLGALMVLLVPTVLMGATLPLLSRFVAGNQEETGWKIGRLYGVNTVGAVLGVLTSGFVLLPHWGQAETLWLAASVNLLLGFFCLFWGFRAEEQSAKPISEFHLALSPRAKFALGMAAVSGFSSMVYETGYNRVLAMILGGSVYAFSTMLAAFLTGLGLGAIFVSRRSAFLDKDPLRALAWTQAAVALMVLATGYCFERLPYLFMLLVEEVRYLGWDLEGAIRPMQFLISFLVMVPTALLTGVTFPLALRAGSPTLSGLGQWVGRVYAWNTLGAILGASGTAFVLIPWFGIQWALGVGAAVQLAAAGVLAVSRVKRNQKTVGALLSGALIVGIFLLPGWNRHPLAIGAFFHAQFFKSGQDFRKSVDARVQTSDLLYYREGVAMTTSVERYKGTETLILSNNGKTEASSIGDLGTQQLAAHLPILWREASGNAPAKRVALIGLASGITAGAALQHPVSQLDVLELEPFMPEAARFFDKFNFSVLDDPRYRFIVDDARHYLGVAGVKYDVVISEPSNPWVSGVSNLFTRECFEIGRASLAEGGVYCQWVQVYGLGLEDVKSILRTFQEVFPNTYVFGIPPMGHSRWPAGDLVVLGSLKPLKPQVEALERLMKDERVKNALKRIEIEQPGDILSPLRMGPEETAAFVGPGGLNTDDNMRIEFSAPLSFYKNTYYGNLWEVRKYQADWTRYIELPPEKVKSRKCLLRMADDLNRYWRKDLAKKLRQKALDE